MKVLLLPSIPYAPLERAAAAGDHPRPMVSEELKRDHGIVVESIDPGTTWKNPFARKHNFYRAFDPLRTLRVLAFHRNSDLVVSGNDGAAVALVALRRLFFFRTPIVIWDLSPAEKWRIRSKLQDFAIPRLAGIISLNQIQIAYSSRRWGAHVPVVHVNHWIDTNFFRPDGTTGADGPILSIGDDPQRDYPTLVRALEGLPVPVAIRTGLPLDLDDQHRHLTILRNRLSPVAFRDLYASCLFVVVPLQAHAVNASGNTAIMEAAAMGKAVIVSDSDGVRGLVKHEETGLVVPANDPVALRRAIDRLLSEPETRERLGRQARRLMETTASSTVFAARLAAAFRTLAKG